GEAQARHIAARAPGEKALGAHSTRIKSCSGATEPECALDSMRLSHFLRRTGAHFGGKCSSLMRGVVVLVALAATHDARSADMAVKAPDLPRFYDWDGFYFGAHVAYGQGGASALMTNVETVTSSPSFGSLYGGFQAGSNLLLPSRILLGTEVDLT